MIFITKSGSKYELDEKENRIRRLAGKNEPTKRIGEDEKWKKYISISPVKLNQQVLVIWENEKTFVPNASPGTITSSIVEIIEDCN